MSENRIQSLEKGSFARLEQVEKISLSSNNLKVIPENAFKGLPSLHSLFLDGNKIEVIQPGAFSNLTGLTNLFLQRNRLRNFSMEIFSFSNIKDDSIPPNLYVNVSHNEITTVDLKPTRDEEGDEGGEQGKDGAIRILDLSHNRISQIKSLSSSVCTNLLSLHLAFNAFSSFSLQSLSNCSALELLTLDGNVISCLRNSNKIQGSMVCQGEENERGGKEEGNKMHLLPSLRVLSLSHNLLTDFQAVKSTFLVHSPFLQVLDLSYNRLQTVTGFACETMEKLILSGNQLTQVQINYSSSRNSLRFIDLSHNLLRDIPESLFLSRNLSTLDFSFNRINDLSDVTFTDGNRLKELFLTGNRIRNMKSRSLIPLTHLELLDMSECGLSQVTEFPLPQLQDLRLNGNSISNISSHFLSKSRRVKRLDLSQNLFPDVPRNLWRFVPGLVHLNVSSNPIEVLDTTSLSNLLKLRTLDISRLSLKYIDTRILHPFK